MVLRKIARYIGLGMGGVGLLGLLVYFIPWLVAVIVVGIRSLRAHGGGPELDYPDGPWSTAPHVFLACALLAAAGLELVLAVEGGLLAVKQARQRALSTSLTMLSVLLGASLGVGIMVFQRGGDALFGQTDFGYDLIIGPPKGDPLTLTLNTVYHLAQSPGNIPYQIYADMAHNGPALPGHPDYHPYVRHAVPFMVGDSYQGRRIVGTTPAMFGYKDDGARSDNPFEYRKGESFHIAEGRVFAPRKFEAVIGSDIAAKLHLHLYDDKLSEKANQDTGGAFQATHGFPGPNEKPDIHKPVWHIVGILQPTHTANDRVLFIPFISLYAIAEHEVGMLDQLLMKAGIDPTRVPPDRVEEILTKLGYDLNSLPESVRKELKIKAASRPATRSTQDVGELMKDATLAPAPEKKEEDEGPDADVYHLDEHGDIVPDLPESAWELSAILVQSRGPFQAEQLKYNFKVIDNRATAVSPAEQMREFFSTFLKPMSLLLLLIGALVVIVAAASIMTTIYNSVTARRREIAILRALGATRHRILALVCFEATLVGLVGAVTGFIAGHLLGAIGSVFLRRSLGEGIAWMSVGREEIWFLLGVGLLAFLAGLVPAANAYRTPVANNLAAT